MEKVDIWTSSLATAMAALWTKLANFAPNFVGALLILLLGYVVAKVIAALLERLMAALGVDRLSERAGVASVLSQAPIKMTMSYFVGRIVFWILMLTFLVSATETLGLARVSTTIDSLVQYLPKVLGSAFMLLVGLFAAGLLRDAIRNAATAIGFEYAKDLAAGVYGLLIVIVVSLAVGQLELETAILTQAISILLLSAGIAAALAFGLGSREVAANVLSGSYVRDAFRVGENVTIGDASGRVKFVGAVNTVLETETGAISIPNSVFINSIAVTAEPTERDSVVSGG